MHYWVDHKNIKGHIVIFRIIMIPLYARPLDKRRKNGQNFFECCLLQGYPTGKLEFSPPLLRWRRSRCRISDADAKILKCSNVSQAFFCIIFSQVSLLSNYCMHAASVQAIYLGEKYHFMANLPFQVPLPRIHSTAKIHHNEPINVSFFFRASFIYVFYWPWSFALSDFTTNARRGGDPWPFTRSSSQELIDFRPFFASVCGRFKRLSAGFSTSSEYHKQRSLHGVKPSDRWWTSLCTMMIMTRPIWCFYTFSRGAPII